MGRNIGPARRIYKGMGIHFLNTTENELAPFVTQLVARIVTQIETQIATRML